MNAYTVTIKLRGTVGKRATAIRRMEVYAPNHEEAIARAKDRLLQAPVYMVKNTWSSP